MKFKSLPLGTRDNVVVLFCDMTNFTAICDELPLLDVGKLLNEYYQEMAGAIVENDGIVGQFVGDAIVGYFGFENEFELASDNALNAGFAIIDRVKKFRLPDGQPILNGVGIDAGRVLVASVGPVADHREQIVIGQPINVTSRLEQMTRFSCHQMLVSSLVYNALSSTLQEKLVDIGERYLRGKDDSLHIYGELLKPIKLCR